MHFYALEPQTKSLGIRLVLLHNIFNALAFPFADPLGKGLRATGDVVFTTFVSLFTTIGVRLVLSVIFRHLAEHGCHGHCLGHVPGLECSGRNFLDPIPSGQVEDIQGDLIQT